MGLVLQMDRPRQVKEEPDSGSSLPANLRPLMYNEPSTSTAIQSSTSAARSTLRDSDLHLRPVASRYLGRYSPEDETPIPPLPVTQALSARPLPLATFDQHQNPRPYASYFNDPDPPYSESSISSFEPQRGRRGGSYPRQLSPRDNSLDQEYSSRTFN